MTISFYDASIPCFLQTLNAISAVLDKGLAFCREQDIDPQDIVEARIHADMHPFRFQINSVAHHSLGAWRGMDSGRFTPPGPEQPQDYAGLQAQIAAARDELQALTPDQVNAVAERELLFHINDDFQMRFTNQGFLLSFSLPNLHFHATAAYAILRAKGAPLGKMDYLGRMQILK